MNEAITSKFKRFSQNKLALTSLVFLVCISLVAVFAEYIAPFSFEDQNLDHALATPSFTFYFGTDTLGRDLFSRTLYGAQVSLVLGVATTLFALVFGTIAGSISGYFGGKIDQLIMRIVDVFYIFPSLLLAILMTVVFGRGMFGIILALGLTSWVTQARLVRGQVMQAKAQAYVEGARAFGASHIRIIWKHILPNIMGPIIISLTFQIPSNILAESFLSFLGLGIEPPFATWGTLASEGFRAMKSFPHLILFPGGILFITLLAFSYLGDGLRDAFDPKTKIQIN